MKKLGSLILVLILVFSLAACSSSEVSTVDGDGSEVAVTDDATEDDAVETETGEAEVEIPADQLLIEKENIVVYFETYEQADEEYNYEIKLEYPQVRVENIEIQNKINDALKGDSVLHGESLIEEAMSYAEDLEVSYVNEGTSSIYAVYADDNILSIVMEYYRYTGGAHGFNMRVPYNFDLATGEFIGMGYVLDANEDAVAVINQQIEEQITEDMMLFEGSDPSIDQNFTMFYFTEDDMVIVYNQYEIAPYSSGIIEFNIPKEALKL